jgi:hypothetical protein
MPVESCLHATCWPQSHREAGSPRFWDIGFPDNPAPYGMSLPRQPNQFSVVEMAGAQWNFMIKSFKLIQSF